MARSSTEAKMFSGCFYPPCSTEGPSGVQPEMVIKLPGVIISFLVGADGWIHHQRLGEFWAVGRSVAAD